MLSRSIGIWSAAAIAGMGAAILMLPYLGSRPFWDYDEAIYANVVRDTLADGDTLSLARAGEPFFEKPPLYFWSSMALDTLFDAPEWSYRITSACAGIASVVLVVVLAGEAGLSVPAALLAGFVLLTTGPFVEASRQMRLDIPTIAAIVFASLCLTKGTKDPRWLLGVGVATAVGFLFKSVIVLLVVIYLLVWSIVERDLAWMRSRYLWLGVAAGGAILLPWHLYESARYGTAFWNEYLWRNVVDRTTSDVLGGTQSAGEIAQFLLAYAAPWSGAFLLVLVLLFFSRAWRPRDDSDRAMLIFSATTVLIASVFMLSTTRIFYYLLPVYPFMALSIAAGFHVLAKRVSVPATVVVAGALLIAGLWVTGNYAYHRFSLMHINDIIVADEAAAGLSIREAPMDIQVFAYQYEYWDTVRFYSGGRVIRSLSDDAVLDRPFFLLVSTPFMRSHSFDPELANHLTERFAGQVVTLYEFRP